MGRQYKDFLFTPTEFDPIEGVIKGYAAVMGNIDQGGDVIPLGAFLKTIAERGPDGIKIGWQHGVKHPLGKTTFIKEVPRSELPPAVLKAAPDATGALYVEGRATLTAKNIDRLKLMADDVVSGLSIGYEAIQEDYKQYKGQHVRMLPEIKLWEWSPVTFAMNTAAQTTVVKGEELDRGTLMDEVKAIVERAFAAFKADDHAAAPSTITEPATQDDGKGQDMPATKVGRRNNGQDEQHLHAAIGHIAAALGTNTEPSNKPDEEDDDTTGMTPKTVELVGGARKLLDLFVKARLQPKEPTSADGELATARKVAAAVQMLKEALVTESTEYAAGSEGESWGLHCLVESISLLECFVACEVNEAGRMLLGKQVKAAGVQYKDYMSALASPFHEAVDGEHSHDHHDAGVAEGSVNGMHNHSHTHKSDNVHSGHAHTDEAGATVPMLPVAGKSGMDEGDGNVVKPPKKPARTPDSAEPAASSTAGVHVATGTDVPPKADDAERLRKDRERRLKLAEFAARPAAA